MCTHSKSLVMPYLWQLLHPNCSLLGCCFLASSHFLSISLPTSSTTSVRQPSASAGLGRAQLSWHDWRGFPQPAGDLCSSEPWGAERSCKCRGFAPCSWTLGHSWVTCTARLPSGVFPFVPAAQEPGNCICNGGNQDVFVNVPMGIKGSPEL